MKHSDISHGENAFGIQLNKSFALPNQSISINNSNSVMIGSVISTPINQNSTILSTALNSSLSKSAVLTKGNSTSVTALSANMIGQLTYINSNNNAIKLINLSKCQPLQNLNKDNSNLASNNAINVQFVTPILNNTSSVLGDCTGLVNSVSKISCQSVSSAPVVLTGTPSQTMLTSTSSITCTRFILHSSQASILPHGTVTIIPQHSDMSGGTMQNHLIKNARYTVTGTKQTPQAIRILPTATSSVVSSPCVVAKQSIGKMSPTKSTNNYAINISDANNAVAIQDLTTNKQTTISKESNRIVSRSTPMVTITSSNNIRLALTSNISNSKLNGHPSKIQLISPKTRIRSRSPVNVNNDAKLKDSMIGSKDENAENPGLYNQQADCYSPTRKRARKQHLKAVTNKLQKLASDNKFDTYSLTNNARHIAIDKSLFTPISIAPTTTKFASITTHNKVDEVKPPITSVGNHISPPIIIPLKNPIQIGPSKMQALTPIYPNNGIVNSMSSKTLGSSLGQVQIISQSSNSRPIQLTSVCQNLILSSTFSKSLGGISPQKVIHIAPAKLGTNVGLALKDEKLSLELLTSLSSLKDGIKNETIDVGKQMKPDIAEVKSEASDDSSAKYSLFPNKYRWNPRRTHFEKESDVKIKKSKPSSSVKQPNLEEIEEISSASDAEISDTSWRLYKASTQFLMQKYFDEENLGHFRKLKEKFVPERPIRSVYEDPVFEKVCPNSLHFEEVPDKIDVKSYSEFTDPRLFGIADDVLQCSHINAIVAASESSPDPTRPSHTHHISHKCSDACIFYLSEVQTLTQPPHIRRITDLIEGLIVKERKIIEKESEINSQCLRLLASSKYTPLVASKNLNRNSTIKSQNGHRL